MQASELDVRENENRGLERLRRGMRLDMRKKRKVLSMLEEDSEGLGGWMEGCSLFLLDSDYLYI